jgi:hypothetical protein
LRSRRAPAAPVASTEPVVIACGGGSRRGHLLPAPHRPVDRRSTPRLHGDEYKPQVRSAPVSGESSCKRTHQPGRQRPLSSWFPAALRCCTTRSSTRDGVQPTPSATSSA